MTKGQRLLGGILSQEEIEEFDSLDVICENLKDLNGRCPNNLIKFLQRKIDLIRKANDIFEELYVGKGTICWDIKV